MPDIEDDDKPLTAVKRISIAIDDIKLYGTCERNNA